VHSCARNFGKTGRVAVACTLGADGTRAAEALNGTDFGGRALKVSEAQERARQATDARGPRR